MTSFQVRFENLILIPNFWRPDRDSTETKPFGIGNVSVDFNVSKHCRKKSERINQVPIFFIVCLVSRLSIKTQKKVITMAIL